MKSYKGLCAVITGASSGIGREMAIQLSDAGAVSVLVARRKDRLEALAAEIEQKNGTKSIIAAVDLLDPDAAQQIEDILKKQNLTADVLINNAGFGYQGDFTDASAVTYRNMTMLNMTSLTDLTRHFLPGMIERKKGGILNVASMAGFTPIPGFSVYAATKTYVIHFTEALWQELRNTGVHASVLCPGPVDTEFFDVAGMDSEMVMFRKVQKPDDVAAAGLQGLLKNKRVVPTSLALKISGVTGRFVPRRLMLKLAQKIMEGQSGK